MEPLARYFEQRFDGKRTFELFPDKLQVRGAETLGADYEQTFRLASPQPEVNRMWYRNRSFNAGLWMFVGGGFAFVVLTWGLGRSFEWFWLGITGCVVLPGLLLAIATCRKVEYAVFRSEAGIEAVSVARSGKEAAAFDAFVKRLAEQIRICEQQPGAC